MTDHISQKNPLLLAFIGDAVHTLFVREQLSTHDAKISQIHKLASDTLCATAQAKRFDQIYDILTEVERDIATRARNAPHNTAPKSCTLGDYHKATALEAVIGYNHLGGNANRVKELIQC